MPSRSSVYVGCAGNSEICQFALDAATGALTPIATFTVPGPREGTPQSLPLAVSPDRRVLYAAVRVPPWPVASFGIDARSGALALLGTAHLPANAAFIATDRSGRHLLSASYGGSLVASNAIDADGHVTGAAHVVADIPRAHSVLVAPDNRHVLVAALGADRLYRLRFDDADGRLAFAEVPVTEVGSGSGPRHLALHPGSRFVYCLNELDGTIDAWALDPASSALSQRHRMDMRPPGTPAAPNAGAADIHVTPDGRFLYASERLLGTLCAFAIDGVAGTLTRIGSYRTEAGPRSFAIDPSGRFLLAAGQVSGRVAVHRIDPGTGALEAVGACDAGPGATWVEIVALPVASALPG